MKAKVNLHVFRTEYDSMNMCFVLKGRQMRSQRIAVPGTSQFGDQEQRLTSFNVLDVDD